MNISRYFPPAVEDIREFKKIADAEQPLFDDLWDDIAGALNENFIDTMGTEGIERFESMLGITPYTSDSEIRKSDIRAELMGSLPYTLNFLIESTVKYYNKNAKVTVNYPKYSVTIRTEEFTSEDNKAFAKFLDRVLPANLVYYISKTQYSDSGIALKAHTGGYRFQVLPIGKEGTVSGEYTVYKGSILGAAAAGEASIEGSVLEMIVGEMTDCEETGE